MGATRMSRDGSPLPQLRGVAAFGPQVGWDAAVILPARNEENRIAACLHALADALEGIEQRAGVILLVSNSSDHTALVGGTVLAARNIPGLVFDLHLDHEIDQLGRIRELGMKAALRIPRGPRFLLTTDADGQVSPSWLTANLAELERADIVFGEVLPDPDEPKRREPVSDIDELARRHCLRLAVRLAALLDPLPHDPESAHHTHSGASIALTAEAFDLLGGMPWKTAGEAEALAARAEALDLRIRHATAPRVVRPRRIVERSDPAALADPWLEPARTFERRYRAKGQLRTCWPDTPAVRELASRLFGAKQECDPAEFNAFGSYWQCLEDTHPLLRRQRLCGGDLQRELPRFAAAVRRLEADMTPSQPPDCPVRFETRTDQRIDQG